MAQTNVQLEVEDWVRKEWLSVQFRQRFSRERLNLTSGGVFDFDAVSGDGKIVASISTSGALTARGKLAVGKVTKIRSDILFLLLASCERRLIVLTESNMFAHCQKEMTAGRLPRNIEFLHADIPQELKSRLATSQRAAFREMTREDAV